ncbi:MAG TPA: CHAT domain-containing protein [Leptolyngbyaceae cyanobacterium]
MKIFKFFCLSLLSLLIATIVAPAIGKTNHQLNSVFSINFSQNAGADPSPTPPLPGEGLSGLKKGGRGDREGVWGVSLSESNTVSLLERGKILYEAGRFSEAATVWEQAAKELEVKGDRLIYAIGLNHLSNAYQELGKWEDGKNAIAKSLNILQTQIKLERKNLAILGQAFNTQANLQLAIGQTEAALTTWKQAEAAYAKAGDEIGIIGSQINQAQALQALGLYQKAKNNLENVNERFKSLPDSLLKATGLRSLGEALQVLGDLRQSQEVLNQSLAIAQKFNSPAETSAILFSLGNHARSVGDSKKALDFYRQAFAIAPSQINQLEALLNQLSLTIESENWETVQVLLPQVKSKINDLNSSRLSIYLQVNLANNLLKLPSNISDVSSTNEISQLLANAVKQARALDDPKAESYALGAMAKLYEKNQRWVDAEKLTQQALNIAQSISANDMMANYAWQLGKIYKQKGNIQNANATASRASAIAAYTQAVNTLQILRSDLAAINPDVQFSFRESVEPVHRELVELLLFEQQPSQPNLKQARQIIEALQLAELDNFFREACLDVKPKQIDAIDTEAAVIYPIILENSLEVIVSLPDQPLFHYRTKLPKTEIESNIDELLQSINPAFSANSRLQISQKIYDWLIEPAEKELATSNIKTLVFVLDGVLRNVPMSVLYDGRKYLIEKYSIALTPGLQLLPTLGLARTKIKALTAGLTEARSGFLALPGVENELKEIANELPTQVLLNQDFTETNLFNKINADAFPIVHFATHGQFSSNPEETFILTWNQKLNIREFEDLLRSRESSQTNPIELLVLSACQTAAGDNRATLGLAGVAVRSGARSTLATLWSVRDLSTATLIAEFYRQLTQPNMTKAEALRRAQLALLKTPKYEHPFYWSPFVLVGNWL